MNAPRLTVDDVLDVVRRERGAAEANQLRQRATSAMWQRLIEANLRQQHEVVSSLRNVTGAAYRAQQVLITNLMLEHARLLAAAFGGADCEVGS